MPVQLDHFSRSLPSDVPRHAVAIALSLVVLALPSAGRATSPIALPLYDEQVRVPVGGSTGPESLEMKFELRGSPPVVREVHVRTGAGSDAALWRLTFKVDHKPLVIGSIVTTLTSNAWNRVVFDTPMTFTGYRYFVLKLEPVEPSSSMEFITVRKAPLRNFTVVSLDENAAMLFGPIATDSGAYVYPALVFVFDDSDPLASPECAGAKLALGNPYSEPNRVRLGPFDGFSITFPLASAKKALNSIEFAYAAPSDALARLRLEGEETWHLVHLVSRSAGFATVPLIPPPIYDGRVDRYATLELEILTGEVVLFGVRVDSLERSACDPLVRATKHGARGHISVNGTRQLGSDVYFSATSCDFPGTAYEDFDGDGFGNPDSVVSVCRDIPAGYVRTRGDCDDTNAAVFPGHPEVCDGVDNDCDRARDEWDDELVIESCGEPLGVCAGTFKPRSLCVDGRWLPCSPVHFSADYQPEETLRDGLDNDCDGQVDEAFVGPPCPKQLGVCAGSVHRSAISDGWAACSGTEYGPHHENFELACDGLDNDCDGEIDEECRVAAETSCGCSSGSSASPLASLLLLILIRRRTTWRLSMGDRAAGTR